MNNPILYVDPDGNFTTRAWSLGDVDDTVIITGNKKQEAFNELQKSVSGELTLSMNEKGNVTYKRNTVGPLSKGASQLIDAIDDSVIEVHVDATSNLQGRGGGLLVGAFQGNETIIDFSAGGVQVITDQEINPDVTERMDKANKKPGETTLHETVESHLGGVEALKRGVKKVGPATSKDVSNEASIYKTAHNNAPPQSGDVGLTMYEKINSKGNIGEIYTKKRGAKGPKIPIQTFPNKMK